MTIPYNFQLKGVRKIDHFEGRALVADDPGLGKTFTSLLYANNFLDLSDSVVVVCPAAVKWHWYNEALKHVDMHAEVLDGRKPPKDFRHHKAKIYVLNYDILGYPGRHNDSWVNTLEAIRPALLIGDEAHMLKNPKAVRTRAFKHLSRVAAYLLLLTGTPITNNPSELFSLLSMLRPEVFSNFHAFAFKYCDPKKNDFGMWEFKGASNLKELHRLLKRVCMIRRRKRDVIKDLPKKSRHVVAVPITNGREYEMAHSEFAAWCAMARNMNLPKIVMKAKQLERVNILRNLLNAGKMKAVISWIEDFLSESDSKLVAFGTRNVSLLNPLYKKFKDVSVLVTGKVRGRARQDAVETFVKQKDKRIFFGNVAAAGVGLDGLQHAADTMAFLDLAWTPAAHEQAEGRLERMGQKLPVSCFYLIARGTMEERWCRLIHEKQEVADAVIDGGKKSGSGKSVFDILIHEAEKEGKRCKK